MNLATWMLHALLAGLLVTVAAYSLDRAPALIGRPRRWIWAAAVMLSSGLAAASLVLTTSR